MKKDNCSQEFPLENTYHWPANGESRPWTEFWVTTFSRQVGQFKSVNILFSSDNGQHWKHLPMEWSCVLGDQDVWHIGLGCFPAGTQIRYAVEAVDQQGHSFWDNHYGKDYYAYIGSEKDQPVSN
ncbi:hypothetical protein P3T73_10415 [Kiritimatiellota bacterium B12222]|nr:hypothetical protein P3T73_10415 [Kiritimatiellota bacterium B12222]